MDRLEEASKLLSAAYDAGEEYPPAVCAAMARAHIALWHAERIQRFEQAQEEWRRKQWEGAPPLPPAMPHPGYVGF